MLVIHPIEPVYDNDSRILILGSFPSVKSREMGFYYGNPKNRFWSVVSNIMNEKRPDNVDEMKAFLHRNHIALWDVVRKCQINGSSDSSILDVTVNDIGSIIEKTNISTIYINGQKALELYLKYIYEPLKRKFHRLANPVLLPSTSPANASWKLDELTNAWKRILLGINVSGYEKIGKAYYSMNDYVRGFYGMKLYKLSIDGGFTCPNRDGNKGYGGCIFCSNEGSGDFAGKREDAIGKQLSEQKALIKDKLPINEESGYIAYFQAYTGTYDSAQNLRNIYMEAISDSEVKILSVATRPDCLEDDILSVLYEMNQIKPVWIELGLQTIHSSTASYIRRGYDLAEYDLALKKLVKIGISQIITHVIIGLPNETTDMIKKTVKYVGRGYSSGIKLQLLHVIEGTDLAKEYSEKRFKTLEMEEYIKILLDCIEELPKDMVIHRLTGDGAKKNLIAPVWSTDKKKVLNTVNDNIRKRFL